MKKHVKRYVAVAMVVVIMATAVLFQPVQKAQATAATAATIGAGIILGLGSAYFMHLMATGRTITVKSPVIDTIRDFGEYVYDFMTAKPVYSTADYFREKLEQGYDIMDIPYSNSHELTNWFESLVNGMFQNNVITVSIPLLQSFAGAFQDDVYFRTLANRIQHPMTTYTGGASRGVAGQWQFSKNGSYNWDSATVTTDTNVQLSSTVLSTNSVVSGDVTLVQNGNTTTYYFRDSTNSNVYYQTTEVLGAAISGYPSGSPYITFSYDVATGAVSRGYVSRATVTSVNNRTFSTLEEARAFAQSLGIGVRSQGVDYPVDVTIDNEKVDAWINTTTFNPPAAYMPNGSDPDNNSGNKWTLRQILAVVASWIAGQFEDFPTVIPIGNGGDVVYKIGTNMDNDNRVIDNYFEGDQINNPIKQIYNDTYQYFINYPDNNYNITQYNGDVYFIENYYAGDGTDITLPQSEITLRSVWDYVQALFDAGQTGATFIADVIQPFDFADNSVAYVIIGGVICLVIGGIISVFLL